MLVNDLICFLNELNCTMEKRASVPRRKSTSNCKKQNKVNNERQTIECIRSSSKKHHTSLKELSTEAENYGKPLELKCSTLTRSRIDNRFYKDLKCEMDQQCSSEEHVEGLIQVPHVKKMNSKRLNKSYSMITRKVLTTESGSGDEEDLFGINDFSNENYDFVVETYNRAGDYLIMLNFDITRQTLSKDEIEHEIEHLSEHADNVSKIDLTQITQNCNNGLNVSSNNNESISINTEAIIICEDSEFDPYVSAYKWYSDKNVQEDECEEDTNYKTSNFSSFNRTSEELSADASKHTSKTIKKQKIEFVIEELIQTEEDYIEGLRKVVKDYKPYMEIYTPQNLIGKTSYIFGNIEAIYRSQHKFYKTLSQRAQIRTNDANEVAQIFMDNARLFELYPLYSKNKPTADFYLKDFDAVVHKRQSELGDKLGISSHLLKPIQRLGKYVMLLEHMYKELKKTDLPTNTVSDAIALVKNAMRKGNDNIAVDSIKDSQFDLTGKGSFLMRAPFNILKPKKLSSMVFLFENIVVFTANTNRNEQFKYVDSIEFSEMGLGICEEKPTIFYLTHYVKSKRGDPNAMYVLEAEKPKVKMEWTQIILEKLWSQLEKARTALRETQGIAELTTLAKKSNEPLQSTKIKVRKGSTAQFYDN